MVQYFIQDKGLISNADFKGKHVFPCRIIRTKVNLFLIVCHMDMSLISFIVNKKNIRDMVDNIATQIKKKII